MASNEVWLAAKVLELDAGVRRLNERLELLLAAVDADLDALQEREEATV